MPGNMPALYCRLMRLERDAKKWAPVFRKNCALKY